MEPANWSPDPTGRHEYRYWDGQRWTDLVANGGVQSNDPFEVQPPAPAVPHAPPVVQRPASAPTQAFPSTPTPPQPTSTPQQPTSTPQQPTSTPQQPTSTPQQPWPSAGSGYPAPAPAFDPAFAAAPVTAPAPEADARRRRPVVVWLVALLCVALFAAGLVVGSVVGGDDDAAGSGGQVGEIFLEPASVEGPDAFTKSTGMGFAQEVRDKALPSKAVGAATPGAGEEADPVVTVVPVPGTTPGLYGGTRDDAECDVGQMIEFLQENPDKLEAWAGVQGIDPESVPDYLRSLTPVVLLEDTRVTNHGFSNGRATPRQSVLERGTAVLVDPSGVPRARCACGNPLVAPIPQPLGAPFTGDVWDDFEPALVLVIVSIEVVIEFVLVDLGDPEVGDKFVRPVGTDGSSDENVPEPTTTTTEPPATTTTEPPTSTTVPETTTTVELGTGDIQITLRWNSTADLDLYVTTPDGSIISFGQPTSSDGGTLDVDANAACSPVEIVSPPVENVFWPVGGAPSGTYSVQLNYFSECEGGTGPQDYTVEIKVDGRELGPFRGTVDAASGLVEFVDVHTFTV